jgi:hypothetical protein
MRALVLAALLALIPAVAGAGSSGMVPQPITLPAYAALPGDMGCHLFTGFARLASPQINAGWSYAKHTILVTDALLALSPAIVRGVLAHEVAHCLQEQDGFTPDLYRDHSRALELDADLRAVRYLCSPAGGGTETLGQAIELMREAAGESFDPADDPRHPAYTLRIAVIAYACEAQQISPTS